jgi:hypothetical protein
MEKVMIAATVAKMTLPLLKKSTTVVLVILIIDV